LHHQDGRGDLRNGTRGGRDLREQLANARNVGAFLAELGGGILGRSLGARVVCQLARIR
jgi:hypothetical protein